MYISKWWGSYVGGCDDSLLLLDYFGAKAKENLSLREVLDDLHLTEVLEADTLSSGDLYFEVKKGFIPHFDMAVDVVIDLSAIVLECLHNQKLTIKDLNEATTYNQAIAIKATKEDIALLKKGLDSFTTSPKQFDLADMMDEGSLADLLNDCRAISDELKTFV